MDVEKHSMQTHSGTRLALSSHDNMQACTSKAPSNCHKPLVCGNGQLLIRLTGYDEVLIELTEWKIKNFHIIISVEMKFGSACLIPSIKTH